MAPRQGADLATRSLKALDRYWGKLTKIYGDDAIVGTWAVALEEDGVDNLESSLVPNLDRLVQSVLSAATPAAASG